MDSSRNGKNHGSGYPPPDAAEEFLSEAKKTLLPILIREIPDELFQPPREAELKNRVMKIVDAWLVQNRVPIGRQLRLKLLESIFADIARASRERFGD